MDIASAVVHAAPGRRDEVRAGLERLRGVEIHAETPDGRFVVTAEDTPEGSAADAIIQLHRLDGVLTAAMVYQYCDDEQRDDQEKAQ
jgi:periplasmic nitrate reductase NapD